MSQTAGSKRTRLRNWIITNSHAREIDLYGRGYAGCHHHGQCNTGGLCDDDYQFHALLIGAVRSYRAGDLIRQIMTNKNLAAASLRSQPIIVPLAL